jgi:hypothetical protein
MNRIPAPNLQNKSPYTLLYNSVPDLTTLKVFGSLVFAFTLQSHRTKLDHRARKCIFLGYKPGVKGVVLLDLQNHSIFLSRDVTHHEHLFPYQSSSPKTPWQYHSTCPTPIDNDIPLVTTTDQSPSPHLIPNSPNNIVPLTDPEPTALSLNLMRKLVSMHIG